MLKTSAVEEKTCPDMHSQKHAICAIPQSPGMNASGSSAQYSLRGYALELYPHIADLK